MSKSLKNLLTAIVVIAVTAAACGSDDDEQVEPAASTVTTTTSAPETTSAPATTAATTETPETATTTTVAADDEMAAPADFYFTETTTGQDMLSVGTQAEADCIREALGDTVFDVLRTTPVLTLTASGGGAATAVPVFECLEPRTGAIVAAALMDARWPGGWTPEARLCITDVAEQHPPLVLVGLGLASLAEIDTSVSAWQDFGNDVYDCLSNPAKVQLIASIQSSIDAITVMERDILPQLLESEIECIRSILGDDGYAELVVAPSANYAFATGEEWPDCVSDETYRNIFVNLNDVAFFGLPDDTRACLETFAVDNPEYVSLLRVGEAQRAAMSDAELVLIADSALKVYDCLEEPLRSQSLRFAAAALFPPPAPVVRTSELPADYTLTTTTTGQEVVALLTENEVACVSDRLSEGGFAAFTAAPVVNVLEAAGRGGAMTASIFVCLEENSLALIGAAFMDAAAGGWSAETRMCVTGLIQARPELVVEWLSADADDPDFTPESLGC